MKIRRNINGAGEEDETGREEVQGEEEEGGGGEEEEVGGERKEDKKSEEVQTSTSVGNGHVAMHIIVIH